MRTFFLSIGFAFIAVLVAFVVPRTFVSELRWEVAWEHRLTTPESTFAIEGAGELDDDYILATTATHFLVFGATNGGLIRSGLRASQFTASDVFFINQTYETPRWAVERWDQSQTRFLEAVGVPLIEGGVLMQRGPDTSLTVTDLGSPFEDRDLLPARAGITGVHLCASCDVPTVVRGDLYGTIELFRWPDGIGGTVERLEHTFETPPFSPSTPVVYAVKTLDHERLVAVVGLQPQRIVVLEEDNAGDLRQSTVLDVSETSAIRTPARIGRIGGEIAVIPLRSQVVMLDQVDLTFTAFPTPGVTAVHGGFPLADATAVVLTTVDGVAAGLVFEDETDFVMWEWIATEVASVRDRPQDGLIVIHRDGLFVAMRVVL